MIIPPPDYSTLKAPAIFTLDESLEVQEVEINGFHKQMPALARYVNVSPYYLSDINIFPLISDELHKSALYLNRAVSAKITVNDLDSSSVELVNSDRNITADRFLTDYKKRRILEGSIEDVSVLKGSATAIRIVGDKTSTSIVISSGITSHSFIPSKYATKTLAVELVKPGGIVMDTIIYTIAKGEDQRLAWVNAYGMIDQADLFEQSSQIKSDNSKIYLSNGWKSINVTSEENMTLISRACNKEDIQSLAYIIQSPNIWRLVDGQWQGVDITSNSIEVYNRSELRAIEITIRPRLRW